MTHQLYQLNVNDIRFPDPQHALNSPDGLLAVGGDLSVERLKEAYHNGIFPWFSDCEPIMWWSPSERAIIELADFHVSKSLRKQLKKSPVKVTINTAFEQVISECINQRIDNEGTWITEQMKQAYCNAHRCEIAHSLEVWRDNKLVAGLYGIMQCGVFCGESMFHRETNCSKLAMWALVNYLQKHNVHFIDCQLENPYLMSLGAVVIPRSDFLDKLAKAKNYTMSSNMWKSQELKNIYD
ncbi:leucyl/phenylalanyl-tRNA--protein transferase [Pseudoalteromonas sp. MMG010]|uniref:leucyl/phenylalanyl-tRNA--protein transferase n=1 Tax=Pseudoalteromonas sp. MMG010 TaxID=2822685 RepID=UPI001B3A18B3|nr:leucyl/phenylalanyl-tRNA--protein transferase [Pseudoalteromonas sp. MMG010]MBQ4832503.1 leucyl/phenylalanyl-tRNA--protein transferase [Pseudoalteromonas sp. MMG010]